MPTHPRELLLNMFKAAIAAAQPEHCVPPHLPAATGGRLVVIGAGKASAEMARVVKRHWYGALSGLSAARRVMELAARSQSGRRLARQ
jgi:glycerate 2-kinase